MGGQAQEPELKGVLRIAGVTGYRTGVHEEVRIRLCVQHTRTNVICGFACGAWVVLTATGTSRLDKTGLASTMVFGPRL